MQSLIDHRYNYEEPFDADVSDATAADILLESTQRVHKSHTEHCTMITRVVHDTEH